MPKAPDVIVIGAGIVGAACAWSAARAGLTVLVLDKGDIASGTTGAGEGNILVSDKVPGAELDLAMWSARLWRDVVAPELGAAVEYDAKGGLVVAETAASLASLLTLAPRQGAAGVETEILEPDQLPEYEPHLARDLAGGVRYPQDAQVQPMLAAAHLLADARRTGLVELRLGEEVSGFIRSRDRVTGVRTHRSEISAGAVINAAGTAAGDIAALAGAQVPVLPRRGFVLVTVPMPPMIRHKVYAAEYVADVASGSADLESSAVVEGTASGTILIGASRERVGYDRTMNIAVLRRLAAQAVRLFPELAKVPVLRAYRGFRPYCPDHLPVIGSDPARPGLLHACGHEGAGIGLAPATAALITAELTGGTPEIDPRPFSPTRFTESAQSQGGTRSA